MSEREASHVLTRENSGEFYANKLGLATEPSTPVVEETPTEVAEVVQSEIGRAHV